jgi:NAD(P)-dependent dehydrogenase (short-subunit alcohol dehydrogenase family)
VAIFGATGGIGSELARRLVKSGHRLALIARSEERLQVLAEETGALSLRADVTVSAEVDAAVSRILETHGRLDGAADCVGSLLLKPAHLTRNADWAATIATNLTSAFYVLRAAAKAMTGQGGSIVLVSSAAASIGLTNHEAIAAAKGGVAALASSAAATYAGKGIRVNCVAPGLVRTPLTAGISQSEAALRASQGMHPLGRIGEPADVAAAMEFLLSPGSGWVTGQIPGIDGGLAALKVPGA